MPPRLGFQLAVTAGPRGERKRPPVTCPISPARRFFGSSNRPPSQPQPLSRAGFVGLAARTRPVPDERRARAILPGGHWTGFLIAARIGFEEPPRFGARPLRAAPHRAAYPGRRHELGPLHRRLYTGYLVKPVSAPASLAARFTPTRSAITANDLSADADQHTAGPRAVSILSPNTNDINALLARALLARLGHRPAGADRAARRSHQAR